MTNATFYTQQTTTPVNMEIEQRHLTTGAATYYPGAMLGELATGYMAKFDDTQSMRFRGINANDVRITLDGSESLGDTSTLVNVQRPGNRFGLKIASASLADNGRLVYALYDNEGTFSASATTCANVIGRMVEFINATTIEVQPVRLGERLTGAARVLAATGAVTLSKFDLNKTIFLTNTSAQAVTLPAVANTQAGDFLQFTKTNSTAQAVTLTGNAAETINGSNTYATIASQYASALLVSDGTQWILTATK